MSAWTDTRICFCIVTDSGRSSWRTLHLHMPLNDKALCFKRTFLLMSSPWRLEAAFRVWMSAADKTHPHFQEDKSKSDNHLIVSKAHDSAQSKVKAVSRRPSTVGIFSHVYLPIPHTHTPVCRFYSPVCSYNTMALVSPHTHPSIHPSLHSDCGCELSEGSVTVHNGLMPESSVGRRQIYSHSNTGDCARTSGCNRGRDATSQHRRWVRTAKDWIPSRRL